MVCFQKYNGYNLLENNKTGVLLLVCDIQWTMMLRVLLARVSTMGANTLPHRSESLRNQQHEKRQDSQICIPVVIYDADAKKRSASNSTTAGLQFSVLLNEGKMYIFIIFLFAFVCDVSQAKGTGFDRCLCTAVCLDT
jgi:hypothetical protein